LRNARAGYDAFYDIHGMRKNHSVVPYAVLNERPTMFALSVVGRLGLQHIVITSEGSLTHAIPWLRRH
jgi:hypothetical protein